MEGFKVERESFRVWGAALEGGVKRFQREEDLQAKVRVRVRGWEVGEVWGGGNGEGRERGERKGRAGGNGEVSTVRSEPEEEVKCFQREAEKLQAKATVG